MQHEDERTTFSPLRIGQVLINSIKKDRPSLVCPEVFYIEDHDLMGRLGAERELAEACSSCFAVPQGGLCSYGCKYDGLPQKPLVRLERWVLPWERKDEHGTPEG